MFGLFRRYQRAIFFVVTVIIVLSFSFFGTYSSFVSSGEDRVVFKTSAGKKVRRSELYDYSRFLGSDSQVSESGFFNPLNDGAVAEDIIRSGIGEVLVQKYGLCDELLEKLKREKTFQPYQHAQAPFLSAVQVWNYFAPGIKQSLDIYQALDSSESMQVYTKKAEAYLAEREFPSVYLRQFLQYQQKQFEWLEPDPALSSRSLALFGYSSVSDWFGPAFLDRSCETIIRVAEAARKAGYEVSKVEALTSLRNNVERAIKKFPSDEKVSVDELFRRTLQQLHLDAGSAAKIWADVLLFRKALLSLPEQVVLSALPFDAHLRQRAQRCALSCYQLQPSLRFSSMRELMRFELWLNAVSGARKSLLLPEKFLRPDEVIAAWPEFVERRFELNVRAISKSELTKKIRVRDLWDWQIEHWNEIEISQLKEKKVETKQEKFALLDSLSPQVRDQVDAYAAEAIFTAHPEWVSTALDNGEVKKVSLGIRYKGGELLFEGISDRRALIEKLLSSARLENYSQDSEHYYRVEVLEKSERDSLVSFPELVKDGSLDRVFDRMMEASYSRIKTDREFRGEKGEPKPFSQVKERVSEIYFAALLSQLDASAREWKERLPDYCHWDEKSVARVAVRFLPHLTQKNIDLVEGKEGVVAPIFEEGQSRDLQELWTLVETPKSVVRSEPGPFSAAFALSEGNWTLPRYSRELGPFVSKIERKDVADHERELREIISTTKGALGKKVIAQRVSELIGEG